MTCRLLQRNSSLAGQRSGTNNFPSSSLRPLLRCAISGVTSATAGGPWVAALTTCPSPRGSTGRRSLVCKAISLPDTVDATVRNIISISAVVGISYAVLLAAVSEPPQPPAPSRALPSASAKGGSAPGARDAGGDGRNDDDNFVWGLMGFISCLPLFDWLAWVLAAISDEDRAALYGIYAALYGSPLLLRGLNWQDPWVLFMLLLCALHVQAERIAQTEPEALRSIRPVGAVGAALRGLVGGAGSLLSGLGGVLAEYSRRVVRRPSGRSSGVSSDSGGERRSGAPAELDSDQDRLQLGQDPDLDLDLGLSPVERRATNSKTLDPDPRRDPSRDPELEDFASRELRQFDEQLRRRAELRGRDGRDGRAGSGAGEGSGHGGGGR